MRKRKLVGIVAISTALAISMAAPAFAYSPTDIYGNPSDAWKRRGPTSIYSYEEQLKILENLHKPQTQSSTWKHPTWVKY